jgi:hypothetical protein
MTDAYRDRSAGELITGATSCVAITAAATEIVATRGVFCKTAGDFVIQFVILSSAVTLTLTAGSVYPFRINFCTSGTGLYALR